MGPAAPWSSQITEFTHLPLLLRSEKSKTMNEFPFHTKKPVNYDVPHMDELITRRPQLDYLDIPRYLVRSARVLPARSGHSSHPRKYHSSRRLLRVSSINSEDSQKQSQERKNADFREQNKIEQCEQRPFAIFIPGITGPARCLRDAKDECSINQLWIHQSQKSSNMIKKSAHG